MFESKYSKVLTVILVIVIIAIIGLLGFLAYDFYQKYYITKEASDFVDNYKGEVSDSDTNTSITDENVAGNLNELNSTPGGSTSTATGRKQKYKGFDAVGTISIPTINCYYPILEDMTPKALETSVVMLYPTNADYLNQPGNCVIVGHNYRNGVFFSNLKRLNNGDKITIDDYKGGKKTYSIYSKFETTSTDTSFYQRDTAGKAEITLSTCTDASNDMRTIILAREE